MLWVWPWKPLPGTAGTTAQGGRHRQCGEGNDGKVRRMAFAYCNAKFGRFATVLIPFWRCFSGSFAGFPGVLRTASGFFLFDFHFSQSRKEFRQIDLVA